MYAYPIEVPPGTGGLAPGLVLSYSTLTRNTEYGWGWSLSLSRIERSTRSGPPAYGSQDEFELDGELLVPDPEAPSTRFHKVRTDFSRILYFPASGGQSDSWEVTRPDGLKMRYGSRSTANARLTNGSGLSGATFRWLLDEVVDPRGNSYRIEYECSSGTTCSGVVRYVYPKRIRYSFRSSAESPLAGTPRTQRLVVFEWGTRANPDDDDLDRPTTLRSGFMVQIDRRLVGIRVGVDADGNGEIVGAEQVRRYELNYHSKFKRSRNSAAPFSQLSEIRRHGVGPADAAFPTSTTFTYSQPGRGFSTQSYEMFPGSSPRPEGGAIRYEFNKEDTTQGLWDLNGDGLLDRLKTRPNAGAHEWVVNYAIPRSQGGPGYGPSILWRWCTTQNCNATVVPATVVDRLINVSDGTDWVLVKADIVDMDGDSLPDRVFVDDNFNWTFRTNLGDGSFGPPQVWAAPALSSSPTRARYLNAGQKPGNGNIRGKSRLVDVNGDGLPDHLAVNTGASNTLWYSKNLGCTAGGPCGFALPVSIPGRLPLAETVSFLNASSSGYHIPDDILDVNGDGLSDFVSFQMPNNQTGCVEVGFGTGSSFPIYAGSQYPLGSEDCRTLQDLNWLGPVLAYSGSVFHQTIGTVADVNGDGIVDKLTASPVSSPYPCQLYFGLGDGAFSTESADCTVPTTYVRGGFGAANSPIIRDTIDIDGDGLVDQVLSSSECGSCTSYNWTVFRRNARRGAGCRGSNAAGGAPCAYTGFRRCTSRIWPLREAREGRRFWLGWNCSCEEARYAGVLLVRRVQEHRP